MITIAGAGSPPRAGLGKRAMFPVHDPATTAIIGEAPDGNAAEAAAAVDAAHGAFPRWASTPSRARAEILRRAYELMTDNAARLAALIASENGKLDGDARAEVVYAAEFFRWYSEEAVRNEGSFGATPGGDALTVVTHRPVGVAALVTPWNFPAAMLTRKIAPALAAGCTVVVKPAAETPLTALAIGALLADAGVPDGVVNIVTTTDPEAVVSTWLADDRVRKVSFTGSTAVGRHLLSQAAARVVNTSMELGGNAPFIVMPDADLGAAVAGALVAKFRNGGQACTAANRIFVHAHIQEEFTERLAAAVTRLSVPPLISQQAVTKIGGLVDRAVAQGAEIVAQGRAPASGWFYPATVLAGVRDGMEIVGQEIFGPVAPLLTWQDETELLRQVNDTELGLAAYVYAGRLQDALRLASEIEVGMVGVNRGVVSDPSAPFGGVKHSGIGREGAREGLREYQETQYLSVEPFTRVIWK